MGKILVCLKCRKEVYEPQPEIVNRICCGQDMIPKENDV